MPGGINPNSESCDRTNPKSLGFAPCGAAVNPNCGTSTELTQGKLCHHRSRQTHDGGGSTRLTLNPGDSHLTVR